MCKVVSACCEASNQPEISRIREEQEVFVFINSLYLNAIFKMDQHVRLEKPLQLIKFSEPRFQLVYLFNTLECN